MKILGMNRSGCGAGGLLCDPRVKRTRKPSNEKKRVDDQSRRGRGRGACDYHILNILTVDVVYERRVYSCQVDLFVSSVAVAGKDADRRGCRSRDQSYHAFSHSLVQQAILNLSNGLVAKVLSFVESIIRSVVLRHQKRGQFLSLNRN